jgi:hypothetical protein
MRIYNLTVDFGFRNLAAGIITVGRNMMRAVQLARGFVFFGFYPFQRVVRAAHVAHGFACFSFRYSHFRHPYNEVGGLYKAKKHKRKGFFDKKEAGITPSPNKSQDVYNDVNFASYAVTLLLYQDVCQTRKSRKTAILKAFAALRHDQYLCNLRGDA